MADVKLNTVQRLKNEAGIWLQTGKYLARVASGRATSRTAGHVHEEYTQVPKDWGTLDRPVLVRQGGTLTVVTHRQTREQYARLVAQAITDISAKRVLEFGCGEGLVYGMAKDLVAAEFHGFDLVPERIRRAKERFPDGNFWVGDATVPQAPAQSFDLAYSCHAVEQMQSVWKQAITQMREVAPYVLLLEPFYERKTLLGKMHSRANGYFRGTINEVLGIGFTLVREYAVPYQDVYNQTTALLLKRVS